MAKTLVSGAKFHDFEAAPEHCGTYLSPVVREKDDAVDEKKKAGDIMGYLSVDDDGEETIIGNSHQIGKAIEQMKKGDRWYIRFIEKTMNSKQQPVNRFEVILLEEGENMTNKDTWKVESK